jgi:hypothetical protein
MTNIGLRLLILLLGLLPAPGRSVPQDPAAAARAAGEPPLGEILKRQGYTIDVTRDEIAAQQFVKAGPGPVRFTPIAAFGLEKQCSAGWYRMAGETPDRHLLWTVDATHNKQDFPPLMAGGVTQFDPGDLPFSLWVSSTGFKDEIVSTEDALQRFIPRFKADDRHKAHVYPVKRGGRLVPNSYIIGWEYSTNNDNQDMVTLVTQVKPH